VGDMMELKPGDIIIYKGNSFVSKFVKFFTKSDYTHTSMLISNDIVIEANWYKTANMVGFMYKPEIMEIYRVKGGLTGSQQLQIVQYAYEMFGKTYDYPQIISYIFERFTGKHYYNRFNSKDHIICSELIDNAYGKMGYDLVPTRDLGNVTPADLATSTLIERIY
jgi:uncharacterized protein YycO